MTISNRKILASLFALLIAALPARADFSGGGQLMGFWAAPQLRYEFIGCSVDDSNLTTYNGFTTQAIGTAGVNRQLLIGVGAEDSATNFSISGVTVDGVAATELVDTVTRTTSSLSVSGIYIINWPSGTTADIQPTFSEAVTGAGICVWAVYGRVGLTATATAADFDGTSQLITCSANTSANGFAVAMSASSADLQTTTWTGLTKRLDHNGAGDFTRSVADAYTPTASTPLSITVDFESSSVGDVTCAVASFAP